jgi:hypothetical protein
MNPRSFVFCRSQRGGQCSSPECCRGLPPGQQSYFYAMPISSAEHLPVDSATRWNSSRDSFYGAYEKPSSGTTEYSLIGILTRPTAIDPFPDGFHSSVKPPENARSGIRRILFIGLKRRIPECRHLLRRLGIETVRPTAPEEKCMHKNYEF